MSEIPSLMTKFSRLLSYATPILTLVMLVVVLASCGGGGGGSAGMPGGGGPMVMPEQLETPEQPEPAEPMLNTGLGQITGWRNNPSAQDLLDHWNDTDGLRQGIGAGLVGLSSSDSSTRLDTLSSILQTPTDTLNESKTLLRNVDAGAMTVIGEREGITYGQGSRLIQDAHTPDLTVTRRPPFILQTYTSPTATGASSGPVFG